MVYGPAYNHRLRRFTYVAQKIGGPKMLCMFFYVFFSCLSYFYLGQIWEPGRWTQNSWRFVFLCFSCFLCFCVAYLSQSQSLASLRFHITSKRKKELEDFSKVKVLHVPLSLFCSYKLWFWAVVHSFLSRQLLCTKCTRLWLLLSYGKSGCTRSTWFYTTWKNWK